MQLHILKNTTVVKAAVVISHEIENPVHMFDQSNTQAVERARVPSIF
jgi:hypothetical protein